MPAVYERSTNVTYIHTYVVMCRCVGMYVCTICIYVYLSYLEKCNISAYWHSLHTLTSLMVQLSNYLATSYIEIFLKATRGTQPRTVCHTNYGAVGPAVVEKSVLLHYTLVYQAVSIVGK